MMLLNVFFGYFLNGEAEGSQFKPRCGQNMDSGRTRTPSEHYQPNIVKNKSKKKEWLADISLFPFHNTKAESFQGFHRRYPSGEQSMRTVILPRTTHVPPPFHMASKVDGSW